MSANLWFSPGVGPDVAIRDGRVHLVYGHAPLQWFEFDLAGTLLARSERPVGYYPKTDGRTVLAHDGEQFVAWARDGGTAHPPGVPVGVHATGLSDLGLQFFYREGDGVFTQTGAYCGGMALPNPYSSYGLWQCRDDGTCLTWDERYYAPKPPGVSGQQHTSQDGLVTVGEGAAGGVAGTVLEASFLLWPGEDTRWPRVSCDGTNVAVCCWGGSEPRIRLWIGTLDELAAMAMPVPVLPTVPPALAGRPLGLGYFHAISDRYGDNPTAPANCTIVLTNAEAQRSPWPYFAEPGIGNGPQKIGNWINVPHGTAWPVPVTPTDVMLYDGGNRLPEMPAPTVTALECYCNPDQTVADCAAALRRWLSSWPTSPVVLVGQAYTRNGQETNQQKLADLQGLPLQLAAEFPQVRAIWWFSDGRPTGTRANEWWRPVHAEAARIVRNPYAMSNHLDTVQQERAKYGTPLGNEHAWRVINATAYTWRSEGWGLLDKPAGNNYQGYSVDVLINITEKQLVDCLQDSEGAGNPTWQVLPWDDSYAARWRPPIPPDGTTPEPPSSDLEARVAKIEAALRQAGAVLSGV